MIIIPEIETILILVPRTGTSSLIKAVKERYPESMRIYRHMEADGIPRGYDQWHKVGVVRNPVERLWSLYKYLQTFDGPYPPEYIQAQRDSVKREFSDWILNNREPFTHPYDTSGSGKFFPRYMIGHNLPENRKSQYVYLRPDLGTMVYEYTKLDTLAERLDLELPHINRSEGMAGFPPLTPEAWRYLVRAFKWDFGQTQDDVWRSLVEMGKDSDASKT